MHWANELIGITWVSGGVSTDGFDCWGLVQYCQHKYYDRSLPDLDIKSLSTYTLLKTVKSIKKEKTWVQTDSIAKDGDCILMSKAKDPAHIGIIIQIDQLTGVLHCVKNTGVIYTKLSDLRFQGWTTRKLYRWK